MIFLTDTDIPIPILGYRYRYIGIGIYQYQLKVSVDHYKCYWKRNRNKRWLWNSTTFGMQGQIVDSNFTGRNKVTSERWDRFIDPEEAKRRNYENIIFYSYWRWSDAEANKKKVFFSQIWAEIWNRNMMNAIHVRNKKKAKA